MPELHAAFGADLEVRAIQWCRGLAVELDDVSRRDLAGQHVVLENGSQLGNVLEQGVESACGKFGEGVIGGGKDCEGAGNFEGVNEAGDRQGLGQCLEMAVGNGNVDQSVMRCSLI